jgi:hypothetical protein
MGRSARWHTAEGEELLLEDGAAEDDRRDLASLRALSIGAGTGLGAGPTIGLTTALNILLRLGAIAWRRFRRSDD